ncbi:nuclear transport factor 2 family protein [Sphingobium lactosutens]|uniref:nuclear transport factor 2 family protein n=1 Tax=Sphingobium lactosutens TaxID=522773 RepID=UPI001C4CE711|nr:nuclear transport factor 2 family protein [Sphingobium lactosutens]
MSGNVERALGVLRELASGAIDKSSFTPDATWWSVTGQHFPMEQFLAILAMLHERTIGGIVIDTGLVIDNGEQVVVEATSDVPLVDGGRYANRYLFLIHFRDGLIREVREYNDSAHLMAAFKLDARS